MSNDIIGIGQHTVEEKQSAFITNVYGLMTGALAITGAVAWYISQDMELVREIAHNYLILVILNLLVVVVLSAAINRISVNGARILFVLYSALNGLTFGLIFTMFTGASIASTFFITGGTFGVMSLYGYFTKRDLTSIGRIAIMTLIGVIIASIVNIFLHSPMIYWITTYIGVLVFVGLVAYDTQKIKAMAGQVNGEEFEHKASIMGALALYLDFINLFLFLLQIFGRRK